MSTFLTFRVLPATGDKLNEVLNIVASGPSAPKPDDDGEVELDIDSVDINTLWRLDQYVNSCLQVGVLNWRLRLPEGCPSGPSGAGVGSCTRMRAVSCSSSWMAVFL
jgi:Bromodomain extra-terminal - transcription regulation